MKNILIYLILFFLGLIPLSLQSQSVKSYQIDDIRKNRSVQIELKEGFYKELMNHSFLTDENRSEVRYFYINHIHIYKKMFVEFIDGKDTITSIDVKSKFSSIINNVIADYNRDKKFVKFKAEYNLPDVANNKKGDYNDKIPNGPCSNMGFENCDFTDWNLTQGTVNNVAYAFTNPVATNNWGNGSIVGFPGQPGGPNSGADQHFIVNAGVDPNVPIQMVNPLNGGTCSAMIGDGNGTNYWASKISQTFLVDPSNADFSYSYAAVMQDPGHPLGEQPYFIARVFDQAGNPIVCGNFESTAGDGSAGWTTLGQIEYKDWSTVIVPLQAYIGQNVTVEFTVGDCGQGGHYGYAYVEASCTPLQIVSSDTVVCGAPVTLNAPSPFNGTYLWNTGATTSSITTSTPGLYTVDLITAPGCFITLDVTVSADSTTPTANFIADTVCLGAVTTFSDLSTTPVGTISNWNWDFDNDGVVDNTTQNPTYTFLAAGAYPINLQVGGGNCGHDTTINIYVTPAPTAGFTFTNECFGSVTNFTDLSNGNGSPITTWQWDFDNNGAVDNTTQNPSNGYPAAGTYTAKLYVSAGGACADSITMQVVVNPIPVSNFTATSECFGTANVFTDMSNITTGGIAGWSWDFGDASGTSVVQNPTYAYNGPGNYNVTLTVTSDSGCINVFNTNVDVFTIPVADFTTNIPCNGSATQFTDQSVIGSINLSNWNWDFDSDAIVDDVNQNPSFIFPNAGAFPVNLNIVDTNGCTHDTTITINVSPQPVAAFTHTNECFGSATGFTDLSNTPSGTITNWAWDFDGNGLVDNATQNPTNGYSTAGTYTAELLVTNSLGCVDSTMMQVVVNPMPVANFDTDSVCEGAITIFNDLSNISTGGILSWSWDFGDASGTSLLQNPTYTYIATGSYNAILTVISDSGCINVFNANVDVNPNPTAAFVTNDVCANVVASFTDNSNGNGGFINDWQWDFDNNGTTDDVVQNPTYSYPGDGVYNAELVVTTNDGCKDTIVQPINIFPMPNANYTFVNACLVDGIVFTDNSVVSSGAITNWDWSFGNTNTSVVQSPTENYLTQGIYNVQLIVTTDNLCKDTVVQTIEVWPMPVVNFDPTEVCLNAVTNFNDLSTVLNAPTANTIISWSWDFDGLGNSNIQNPSYTFTTEGAVPTTLTVTTNNGCTKDTTINVTVHPLPQVSFTGDSASCAPLCMEFINTSSISSGTIDQWQWDFGDQTNSGGFEPSHCYQNDTYASVFQYDVTVTAISNWGCSTTLTKPQVATVYPIPNAHFIVSPEITDVYDREITFTDLSIVGSTWLWDLGDGATTTVQNPIHEYADSGNYLITLFIENIYGCKDTTDKLIRINPAYAIWIPNVFTPDGDGLNDFFFIDGFGLEEIQLRIFNRWGDELLYTEGEKESVGWDGSYKGSIVQEDVYVYRVRVKDVFDKWTEYIGRVTLIK
jgi:gliding motility-associated-like protein